MSDRSLLFTGLRAKVLLHTGCICVIHASRILTMQAVFVYNVLSVIPGNNTKSFQCWPVNITCDRLDKMIKRLKQDSISPCRDLSLAELNAFLSIAGGLWPYTAGRSLLILRTKAKKKQTNKKNPIHFPLFFAMSLSFSWHGPLWEQLSTPPAPSNRT